MTPAGEDQERLTTGRASAILSVGLPVSSVYWLACLPGLLGLSGLLGLPVNSVCRATLAWLQGYRATDTDISSVAYKTP